jgi:hypothetical protein
VILKSQEDYRERFGNVEDTPAAVLPRGT